MPRDAICSPGNGAESGDVLRLLRLLRSVDGSAVRGGHAGCRKNSGLGDLGIDRRRGLSDLEIQGEDKEVVLVSALRDVFPVSCHELFEGLICSRRTGDVGKDKNWKRAPRKFDCKIQTPRAQQCSTSTECMLRAGLRE